MITEKFNRAKIEIEFFVSAIRFKVSTIYPSQDRYPISNTSVISSRYYQVIITDFNHFRAESFISASKRSSSVNVIRLLKRFSAVIAVEIAPACNI